MFLLLFNVVFEELDWELDWCGLCFVCYVDDVNIFVCRECVGYGVLSLVCCFIEGCLCLKINEIKSLVDCLFIFYFLGFWLNCGKEGCVEVY